MVLVKKIVKLLKQKKLKFFGKLLNGS